MLSVKDISKSFGKTKVLNGISIDVNQGDVLAILGSSGTGKTTLLRCIEFFEKADQGRVDLGDLSIDLKAAKKDEILELRKRTAFVFQNHNLFANKTALENVTLGLIKGRKVPKAEAEEKAKEALDLVGLSGKYDNYPSQLSGGQQQRVGIARAIAVNPEVIFFDEPTSALDPELTKELEKLFKKLAADGATMVIVTHDIAFAQAVSSRVIFMESGNIVEEGDSKEIFNNPRKERTRQFLSSYLNFDYQI